MKTTELISDNQSLIGAKRGNYDVPVYDDSWGPMFICRNSTGICGIVRAQTWEDAYSICEDEFFPEAEETIDEIVKEYGFRRDHVKIIHDGSSERTAVYPGDYPGGVLAPGLTFVRWDTVETPDPEAWPDNALFQEAFGFRPNGPRKSDTINHGIYSKDLNGDYLDILTPELVKSLDLTLEIENNEL